MYQNLIFRLFYEIVKFDESVKSHFSRIQI